MYAYIHDGKKKFRIKWDDGFFTIGVCKSSFRNKEKIRYEIFTDIQF